MGDPEKKTEPTFGEYYPEISIDDDEEELKNQKKEAPEEMTPAQKLFGLLFLGWLIDD